MAINILKGTRLYKWITLKKYCELTGDTKAAVHARRHKGVWLDGKQTMLAPDGNLWVDLVEIEQWVKHGNAVKH